MVNLETDSKVRMNMIVNNLMIVNNGEIVEE